MNETTKAYIAGLIDGEGSIFLKLGKVHRKGKTYTHMIPQVSISMTDKATVDYVKDSLNLGKYYTVPRKQWRTQYYLVISKRDEITETLHLLWPYLRTKTLQCGLMLEFCQTTHSKETRLQDLEIMRRLRLLNTKGP